MSHGETLIPTDARQAYRAGANAEARARDEGLDRDVRELRDYVIASGRGRFSRDRTVEGVACVFTAEWSLRRRLRLAWRVVTKR